MKQVKIFDFIVSNAASSPCSEDVGTNWYIKNKAELSSSKNIEDTINGFLIDNNCTLIDLKVNNVDVYYHNNARGNTIKLVYTLIYKESEED